MNQKAKPPIMQGVQGGAIVGLTALAGITAFAFGGGREARRGPPAPIASSSSTSAIAPANANAASPTSAAPAEEVELRLTHVLDGARVDAPALARGETLLAAHWRRMQIPWIAMAPLSRRVTTSIALRTSAEEKQWSMPKKDGSQWAPDAKIWNMNEGSYDQRESIFAPTPAQIAFRVTVPPAARLTFAAALAEKHKEGADFIVTVADGTGGSETEVCKQHVAEPEQWRDVSCDLATYAGRSVELRLKTQSGTEAPALALWGNPTVLARRAPQLPYNVLFIVVDALRPDVLASFHDDREDAAKRSAETPPLDALLPKVKGLMPVLDELAEGGVRFTHAWSGGAWTRPGTLAMLGGALSSQLGLDPFPWVVPDTQARAYYESAPPLLPLMMRQAHVATRAFVNNYFMVGYAAVGVDMGFERVDDHRFRTRDTLEVTENATRFLKENKDTRFFAFVNYNSPHEPWEPPARMIERLPAPCGKKAPDPCGPNEDIPRKYMAEAAKDDEAVGVLLKTLGDLGLRERTLVVVTADHGETLSAAHDGRSKLDDLKVRFHHAVSNYEETTRVPIIFSLPGVLPAGKIVKQRVSTTDIAPTILELEGLARHPKMTGRSHAAVLRGAPAPADDDVTRPIVSEGRGMRALLYENHRLLLREGNARTTTIENETLTVAEELYDLASDPGERKNLAKKDLAKVADLRARLEAALKNVPTADVSTGVASTPTADAGADGPALVSLRFAGGGKAHRVTGTLAVEGGSLTVAPIGVAKDSSRGSADKVDLAFMTDAEQAVGFDVTLEPATATLKWEIYVDDRPLAKERMFGGAFGLAEPALEHGLVTDKARDAARGARLPEIDASRDLGMFVLRKGGGAEAPMAAGGAPAPERASSGAAAAEMDRMLKEWGYANSSNKTGAPRRPK